MTVGDFPPCRRHTDTLTSSDTPINKHSITYGIGSHQLQHTGREVLGSGTQHDLAHSGAAREEDVVPALRQQRRAGGRVACS